MDSFARPLAFEDDTVLEGGALLALLAVVAVLGEAEPVHIVTWSHDAVLLIDSWASTDLVGERFLFLAGGGTTERAEKYGTQTHLIVVVMKKNVQRGTGW